MASQQKPKAEPLRVAATVVMDLGALNKAKDKAAQHGMDLGTFLEQACRMYGKVLDKKVLVIARPI